MALIGLAAGWLAGVLTKGRGYGVGGNMAIGVIGAVVGGAILHLLGWAVALVFQLLIATLGAVVLIFLLRKFGRRV